MHEALVRIAIATTLACASGSACAMTSTAEQKVECHVVNGAKLSQQSGGAGALCRAVETAIGEQALSGKYKVEITVLGPSRISAFVTSAGGRKFAERKYGSMDRDLTDSSFERFAKSLAADISEVEGKAL